MLENTHNITWQTYTELTKTEILPGDEKMDAIITNWNEELHYSAKKPKKKQLIKKIKKTIQKQMKTCKNCANTNQKLLKRKSIQKVKYIHCLHCGYKW